MGIRPWVFLLASIIDVPLFFIWVFRFPTWDAAMIEWDSRVDALKHNLAIVGLAKESER